jgi:hypothetical protein
VEWPPASADLSPGAEERPLLVDASEQCSAERDSEHYLCVIVICKV